MLLYLVLVEEKYKPEKITATHWLKQIHLAFQPTIPALTCHFPLIASQDYETVTCLQFKVSYPTTVKLRFAKIMTTTPRNHPIILCTLHLWDRASHGTYSAISILLNNATETPLSPLNFSSHSYNQPVRNTTFMISLDSPLLTTPGIPKSILKSSI